MFSGYPIHVGLVEFSHTYWLASAAQEVYFKFSPPLSSVNPPFSSLENNCWIKHWKNFVTTLRYCHLPAVRNCVWLVCNPLPRGCESFDSGASLVRWEVDSQFTECPPSIDLFQLVREIDLGELTWLHHCGHPLPLSPRISLFWRELLVEDSLARVNLKMTADEPQNTVQPDLWGASWNSYSALPVPQCQWRGVLYRRNCTQAHCRLMQQSLSVTVTVNLWHCDRNFQ